WLFVVACLGGGFLCGLFLHSADSDFATIAVGVHFQDDGVVHEAVDGGNRHGLVGEDLIPAAEWLIGRDEQAAALVACGDQLEQHAGLGLILADIREVVED